MSDDRAYELRELMTNFVQGFEAMGEAARKALEGLELTTPPADELYVFEHTDEDGDSLAIGPNQHGQMMAEALNSMPVRLDQDAVNRLARYLDRHRTDQVDTREPDSPAEHWCGRNGDHAAHDYDRDGAALHCQGVSGEKYGA